MPLTTYLNTYFDRRTRDRGLHLSRSAAVSILKGNERSVVASVQGTLLYRVELSREGDEIAIFCTCPYFESESECKHVWATLLVAERRGYLQPGDAKPPTLVYADDLLSLNGEESFDEEFVADAAAKAVDPLPARRPEWYQAMENLSRQAPAHTAEKWPDGREIYYLLMGSIKVSQSVGLRVCVRDRLKSGAWGKLKAEDLQIRSLASVPDSLDREILLSFAAPQQNYFYSKINFQFVQTLVPGQAELLLPKMCGTGRCILQTSLSEAPDLNVPLRWDEGGEWKFRVAPIREGQYWRFSGCFYRGDERLPLKDIRFVSAGGILATSSVISRVDVNSGLQWLEAVWPRTKLLVPDRELDDFLQQLSRVAEVPEIEWPAGFGVEEVRSAPRPKLVIREDANAGERSRVYEGALAFEYAQFVASSGDTFQCRYDRESRKLYWRDPQAELTAAKRLEDLGAKPGRYPGMRSSRWEISERKLTHVLSELQNDGWALEAEGKTFRRAGAFQAQLSTGIDWFDLHGAIDFEGQSVSLPQLLAALAREERTVLLPDGSVGLIPDDFVAKYGLLAGLGTVEGNSLRFQRSQARLLDVLLASTQDVNADQAFAEYRSRVSRFEGIAPAPQPSGFEGSLRDYQREGLAWLRFLQEIRLGGCLADDMGVGKTAQVLALLETRREMRASGSCNGGCPRPSLVIAPRSIIFNWQQEAARFTPLLRVLDYAHAERRASFDEIGTYDVVLATYGTLRRDILELRKVRFDYVVLDEAQAIKNAASDSAKAARLLTANHRLALSGTPVENHLGELGSLFEFLNPGMLGSKSGGRFAGRSLRNPDEETRTLLGRALRPFILRRTKGQVARELPNKTEQTLYCELPDEQRKLYNELRDHYRSSLLGRVDASGLGRARMHILEALLRLRQAACHPGLIDAQRRDGASGKLDVLMPQIREVLEGGHKLLVFSQFTSFLSIVRERLDEENIRYAYLDGQTKDRQAAVEQFQSDPGFPVFLISLKAGGLGLNLTAAEYVFLLDPWWNPAVEAQAIDRTHRIGQINHVFAYRLIAQGTVEEKVMQLQEHKRKLADEILTAENSSISSLTREDLELLLS